MWIGWCLGLKLTINLDAIKSFYFLCAKVIDMLLLLILQLAGDLYIFCRASFYTLKTHKI